MRRLWEVFDGSGRLSGGDQQRTHVREFTITGDGITLGDTITSPLQRRLTSGTLTRATDHRKAVR
jgi:hypothetical protein